MATLADLQATIAATSTALDNIRSDIDAIKASLPASGGLTAEEVATLQASLDALSAKAGALDAENPAA